VILRTLALAAAAAAIFAPSSSPSASPEGGGRFAIGLAPDADPEAVARAVEARTGAAVESLAPIPALVVDGPRGASLVGLPGVRYVEPLVSRRLAYVPTDPFVPRQWYLTRSRFYESWPALPPLRRAIVAVIDSGVDAGHPELDGRILDARSFVGGSARVDTLGHGTFVAGLIAAWVDNGIGIAGLASSAELIVAKVVTSTRQIPIDAEVRAIRWAVDSGARVINLSLGGVRDPLDPSRDRFSRLEADAIAYAVSKGVVVVAAVGNADDAPRSPWPYASYPAALPHVLGVSAVAETGSVPRFSNRDRIYNDIAAPGERIFSLLPRSLTASFPTCVEQGYSSCGPEEFRDAQGTSYAAPQVSAAAAVLLALLPGLRSEQVTAILQRTAADSNAETGCPACAVGRDALTGWGKLDVAAAIAALEEPLPARDRFEPNDDTGARAVRLSGSTRRISATVDFWDDQDDVYAIYLERGQRVYLGLTGPDPAIDLTLAVWRPRTPSVTGVGYQRFRAALSSRPGSREHLVYEAKTTGWHFAHVRASGPGTTPYRLTVVKG